MNRILVEVGPKVLGQVDFFFEDGKVSTVRLDPQDDEFQSFILRNSLLHEVSALDIELFLENHSFDI